MITDRGKDKPTVGQPYKEILRSNQREKSTNPCKNMDESQKLYIEGKKLNRKVPMLYDFIYRKSFLKAILRNESSGYLWGEGGGHLTGKGPRKTFWGNGNVLYLNLDFGYLSVYVLVKTHQTVLFREQHFILCKLDFNKEKTKPQKENGGEGWSSRVSECETYSWFMKAASSEISPCHGILEQFYGSQKLPKGILTGQP